MLQNFFSTLTAASIFKWYLFDYLQKIFIGIWKDILENIVKLLNCYKSNTKMEYQKNYIVCKYTLKHFIHSWGWLEQFGQKVVYYIFTIYSNFLFDNRTNEDRNFNSYTTRYLAKIRNVRVEWRDDKQGSQECNDGNKRLFLRPVTKISVEEASCGILLVQRRAWPENFVGNIPVNVLD